MSPLRQALADYLTIRRAMGYKLERPERLLVQFIDYLDEAGAATVTTEHALAWAMLPAGDRLSWWADRLAAARGFAAYLVTIDAATEVPPADLPPSHRRRGTPYLYSKGDIAALLAAAEGIRSALRAATHRTLLGLLSVTGPRIGEAIGLDRGDLDVRLGLLVARSGKLGKSRQLPLRPTAVQALSGCLAQRDRLHPNPGTPAMLISTAGTRLCYRSAAQTFRELADRAGLTPRSASCRPRPHDLRHTFAVNTVLDAYRTGADVQAVLPLLSTWLGHVDPAATYWYLSAAPELLALAGSRLEDHLGDRP
ncbi:MAG: tyrosine-type recombinase/integrase [Egibacteraceae bacterium]